MRLLSKTLVIIFLLCLVGQTGCRTLNLGNGLTGSLRNKLTASNERDWRPELAVMPFVETNGSQYTIRNIRNCNYITEDDFVTDYYDRQIDASQIRSVDFIVAPFAKAPKLAHTMMSFGLDDGTYLAVSVEVRKELGEKFSPLLGLAKQFELIYVLSDERDVIRLRTEHHKSNVLVYPTVATAGQAQVLFADVIQRVNKLSVDPEFYHSITNNCTTNLAAHVNQVSPDKINYGWKVLLPGFSAEYAYELGLLDNRIPFEDLTQVASINDLAKEHFDSPYFSKLIRSERSKIDRYIARQQRREPIIHSRGEEYLESLSRARALLGSRFKSEQVITK